MNVFKGERTRKGSEVRCLADTRESMTTSERRDCDYNKAIDPGGRDRGLLALGVLPRVLTEAFGSPKLLSMQLC